MTPGTDAATARVDALLERLVSQFASPYDFLRELVQNSLDAGADRVDVTLEAHPVEGGAPDDVILELSVIDTGQGMDESVIDGELTRLFGTSKEGDRSKAGGFGIGFVSVFAWEPDAVLLQTGRAGESWELVFHSDRKFEKVPVDQPVEGTAVHLFRRARAAEQPAVAEAVRDSLWRWCRFSPLELTFEDLDGEDPPELIQDSPEHDSGELIHEWTHADTRINVAFDVPATAVLMRHGLVLEEGVSSQVLPGLAEHGRTTEHLRVWVDSPKLRTTMARDKAIDDDGRAEVERLVGARVAELVARLVERVTAAAAAPEWDARRHAHYAYLHAHLALEREAIAEALVGAEILRLLEPAGATSVAALARRGACLVADPDDSSAVLAAARDLGIPVLAAQRSDDAWLAPMLALRGLRAGVIGRDVSRAVEQPDLAALETDIATVAAAARGLRSIRVGRLVDLRDPRSCLVAVEVGAATGTALVMAGAAPSAETPSAIWLNADHPAVVAAARVHPRAPRLAAATLALAVGAVLSGETAPEVAEFSELADGLRSSDA